MIVTGDKKSGIYFTLHIFPFVLNTYLKKEQTENFFNYYKRNCFLISVKKRIHCIYILIAFQNLLS